MNFQERCYVRKGLNINMKQHLQGQEEQKQVDVVGEDRCCNHTFSHDRPVAQVQARPLCMHGWAQSNHTCTVWTLSFFNNFMECRDLWRIVSSIAFYIDSSNTFLAGWRLHEPCVICGSKLLLMHFDQIGVCHYARDLLRLLGATNHCTIASVGLILLLTICRMRQS